MTIKTLRRSALALLAFTILGTALLVSMAAGAQDLPPLDNDGQVHTFATVNGVTIDGHQRNQSCSVTTNFHGPAGTIITVNQDTLYQWDVDRHHDGKPAGTEFRIDRTGYLQITLPSAGKNLHRPVTFTIGGVAWERPVPYYGWVPQYDEGKGAFWCGETPVTTTSTTQATTTTTTQPVTTTVTEPPSSSTTQPPVVTEPPTTQPPVTTEPPVTTTQPEPTTTQPEPTTTTQPATSTTKYTVIVSTPFPTIPPDLSTACVECELTPTTSTTTVKAPSLPHTGGGLLTALIGAAVVALGAPFAVKFRRKA